MVADEMKASSLKILSKMNRYVEVVLVPIILIVGCLHLIIRILQDLM